MDVIHVAENTDGYEIVTLLANRVNLTNSLLAIEKQGKTMYSGGFIFPNTVTIRAIFDAFHKHEHYELAKSLKVDPFAKFYYETYEDRKEV